MEKRKRSKIITIIVHYDKIVYSFLTLYEGSG